MSPPLYIKRLTPDAVVPIKQNVFDAAHDLFSIEDVTIPVNGKALVRTGLSIQVPEGTYGQIAPRSGLSMKGIFVNAGVIDRGYTGEVKVILFNFGDKELELPAKSRVAQLIVKYIASPQVVEVDNIEAIDERSHGGFGSTGLGMTQMPAR